MFGSSLRARLFQAIGVVVIICVALTIALGLVLTRRAVEKATLQDVAHQADIIRAIQSGSGGSLPSISTLLQDQHEQLVTSRKPNIVPRSSPSRRGGSSDGNRLSRGPGVQGIFTLDGVDYYYAARPANPGYIVLFRPVSTATALSSYVWGLIIAASVGGLARRARRVPRRAPDLASRRPDRGGRAHARGGTHPEPVPVEGATEIATLAASFNALVEQLQRAQEAERNFLLSVSHELKTPLTAIRGYAEAVEDGAIEPRRGGRRS